MDLEVGVDRRECRNGEEGTGREGMEVSTR